MSTLSIRIPQALNKRLISEARLEGKGRSELAREAIADFLYRRERERFMDNIVRAARTIGRCDAGNATVAPDNGPWWD